MNGIDSLSHRIIDSLPDRRGGLRNESMIQSSMDQSGVALIVVLWIMAILTLLMYAFLAEMRVEYALSGGFGERKKAEQLAWSGIDQAIATVENDPKPWQDLNDLWSHDEERFFEYPLGEGAFTLLHPTYAEDGRMLWGLEDEASKININTAPREVLLKLPRMTEEVADSIIDWRDADSEPSPSGAEDSYYQSRQPSYQCKNQPFDTVEELHYVRGVTKEVLYGEDTNLNGRLDPNENDGDDTYPPDDRDGRLDPGIYAFVTVVTSDRNTDIEGQPRVNVNSASQQELQDAGLEGGEIQTIVAFRSVAGYPTVAHLLGNPELGIPPTLTPERFKGVAGSLAVVDEETLPGLVNINTAPRPVLEALPGVTREIARRIEEHRTQPEADLSNIGWLTDVMEPAELQQVANMVTTRSYQFRIHVVGRIGTPYEATGRLAPVPERAGAFSRMVAIFDRLAQPQPRIVYWKDLTKLGRAYVPEDGPNPLQ